MICERCLFGCPWNGRGWGCSHPGYEGLIEGTDPPCAGAEFREQKPWHRIGPKPVETQGSD